MDKLPSEVARPHDWRTRSDPFADVWEEVYEQLEVHPELQGKSLFAWLQRRYPGRFQDGQLRTFQRGVKVWRATRGPQKEVYFFQDHPPGRLCASDFTHMNSLDVTIQGQRFDHLLYHFVLTYSNWEWVTICFSESWESLSEGLQESLWELGGVPQRHRSDRMSAAVNNLSESREFTARYAALMKYYGLIMEKIGPARAHENGDAESSHRHLKVAVDQSLMLRGSRDFSDREAYAQFLRDLVRQRNAGRQKRLEEERQQLQPLPPRGQPSHTRFKVTVNVGSLIRVQKNTYSVHSRLIGEEVEVRLHADYVAVWYAQQEVERLPRLRGSGKHRINYRHLIDWLVRKPGAFENYRYRDDLFPTSRFRLAYDLLRQTHVAHVAAREYLAILQLAARDSEVAVDDALRILLDQEQPLSASAVQQRMRSMDAVPAATEVAITPPNLLMFDDLFHHKEAWHDHEHGCEDELDSVST